MSYGRGTRSEYDTLFARPHNIQPTPAISSGLKRFCDSQLKFRIGNVSGQEFYNGELIELQSVLPLPSDVSSSYRAGTMVNRPQTSYLRRQRKCNTEMSYLDRENLRCLSVFHIHMSRDASNSYLAGRTLDTAELTQSTRKLDCPPFQDFYSQLIAATFKTLTSSNLKSPIGRNGTSPWMLFVYAG